MAAEEAPQGRHARLRAVGGQPVLELGQGDVGNLRQRRMDLRCVRLGAVREPVAALRPRPGVALPAASRRPAERAGRADPEALGSLTTRQPAVDGGQNPRAKIERQRLGHACRPPSPAPTLNRITPRLGIPRDSRRAKAALVPTLRRKPDRSAGLLRWLMAAQTGLLPTRATPDQITRGLSLWLDEKRGHVNG